MLLIWMTAALPFVFLCVVLYMLPHFSRRTHFFAVTVPPDFRNSPEAQRILRGYQSQVGIHCAIAIALFVLLIAFNALAWLELAFFWPVAGAFIAVFLAHRQALRYAVPAGAIRQATLRPRPASLPGGPILWAGPFAILVAAGIYAGLHWNEIPDRFPVHWGFDNQPNGWAKRSIPGVYMQLCLGLFICFLVLFISSQILKNSRGSTAMRKLNVTVGLVVAYLMAGLFGWLTASLPLGHSAPGPSNIGILTGGGVAVLIAAIVYYGTKAKAQPEPDGAPPPAPQSVLGLSDNTADRNWVGGLFYFNPDDPALFIERRIGIGYDLNFGNPRSWIFLGVLLCIPLAAVLWPRLM